MCPPWEWVDNTGLKNEQTRPLNEALSKRLWRTLVPCSASEAPRDLTGDLVVKFVVKIHQFAMPCAKKSLTVTVDLDNNSVLDSEYSIDFSALEFTVSPRTAKMQQDYLARQRHEFEASQSHNHVLLSQIEPRTNEVKLESTSLIREKRFLVAAGDLELSNQTTPTSRPEKGQVDNFHNFQRLKLSGMTRNNVAKQGTIDSKVMRWLSSCDDNDARD